MKAHSGNTKTVSREVTRLERQVKELDKKTRRLEKKNCRLREQNEELREQIRLLKLQLDEYRQRFFKKKEGKNKEEEKEPRPSKKRGAPKGHHGTTRRKPSHVDKHIDVFLEECPKCGGNHLKRCKRYEDHYQEDIVIPRVKATRFRHHFYYCADCKEVVYGVGKGELPGSYIGPVAKSVAGFLHYHLKVPYRPIQRLFGEVLGLDFDPSSCPGFDRQIRIRGDPIYERLKGSLIAKPFTHVDETGWRKEGVNHWLWCFAALGAVVYLIDRSRGGKVVTSVLGKKYSGVLISDFLAAYNRVKGRKQRCLVHLLRQIKKWQVYFADDRKMSRYFSELKALIKSIMVLSQKMTEKRPRSFIVRKVDIIARLRRILKRELGHPRADKFRRKLLERMEELITCLDFDKICSHNNWAERLLRGSVIMRKVTFGNRSDNGIRNHEVLMSLIETARYHNLNVLHFLYMLLTDLASATTVILSNQTSKG